MTQEQALEEFRKIVPEWRDVSVSRDRYIGAKAYSSYYLWDGNGIFASSDRSWEHALAIAKSGNENCWPEQDEPFEDKVSDREAREAGNADNL